MRLAIVAALLCGVLATAPAPPPTKPSAQSVHQPTPKEQQSLVLFLRHYEGGGPHTASEAEWPTRYYAAFVGLKHDGTREVIVYMAGAFWCGSGCTTLVLAPQMSSYRVVTSMTMTRPPIRVLPTESHGWHDIAVWVEGGRIQPGYEAVVRFNGKTYPSNPSVLPARPLGKKAFGKVVISATATGKLLFRRSNPAQASRRPSARQQALKRFLQSYLGPPNPASELEGPTLYSSAFVSLRGDGAKEALVYLTGYTWCGSGGCTMLVLAPVGASYRAVTSTTVTRLPIRVLAATSHGWHDIGVWVQGGGIQPGYEAVLRFNGKTYPSNPTVPPARRLTKRVPGKVVIAVDAFKTARRLYQLTEPGSLPQGPSPPATVFLDILGEIKAKSHVPVLLPSRLPKPVSEARYAVFGGASATKYSLSLYYHYEWDIGFIGSAAFFEGDARPGYSPKELGNVRKVGLARGLRGFFRPVSCGGSCAPANLWWEERGVLYQIQLGLSSTTPEREQEKTIVATADSAILAGPR